MPMHGVGRAWDQKTADGRNAPLAKGVFPKICACAADARKYEGTSPRGRACFRRKSYAVRGLFAPLTARIIRQEKQTA